MDAAASCGAVLEFRIGMASSFIDSCGTPFAPQLTISMNSLQTNPGHSCLRNTVAAQLKPEPLDN